MALIVGLKKVVTHRIPEKEREPQLFYYELRRRADDWSLPATIEDKVAGDDLWGTMVLSLPIKEGFNEKNFIQVSEDLAEELKKLAGRTKKLYKFSTSMLIAAESEEQAKYKFADASSDFAANAEVEEITDEEELQKHEYLLTD
ncbi:MAG: hypothetical protein HZB80_01765 [Deltaproteobacteria bacterium]|nr:hypothetical protein [Deltaproteobacteria bacterium]